MDCSILSEAIFSIRTLTPLLPQVMSQSLVSIFSQVWVITCFPLKMIGVKTFSDQQQIKTVIHITLTPKRNSISRMFIATCITGSVSLFREIKSWKYLKSEISINEEPFKEVKQACHPKAVIILVLARSLSRKKMIGDSLFKSIWQKTTNWKHQIKAQSHPQFKESTPIKVHHLIRPSKSTS